MQLLSLNELLFLQCLFELPKNQNPKNCGNSIEFLQQELLWFSQVPMSSNVLAKLGDTFLEGKKMYRLG